MPDLPVSAVKAPHDRRLGLTGQSSVNRHLRPLAELPVVALPAGVRAEAPRPSGFAVLHRFAANDAPGVFIRALPPLTGVSVTCEAQRGPFVDVPTFCWIATRPV